MAFSFQEAERSEVDWGGPPAISGGGHFPGDIKNDFSPAPNSTPDK